MCVSMFTCLQTTPVSTLFKMPVLVTCPPTGHDHTDMSEDLQRRETGWREADALKALRATRDKVPLTTRDRGRFQETTPMRPDSSTWKREQAVRSCQDFSGAQREQSGHGGGFVPPTVTPEATAQGLR